MKVQARSFPLPDRPLKGSAGDSESVDVPLLPCLTLGLWSLCLSPHSIISQSFFSLTIFVYIEPWGFSSSLHSPQVFTLLRNSFCLIFLGVKGPREPPWDNVPQEHELRPQALLNIPQSPLLQGAPPKMKNLPSQEQSAPCSHHSNVWKILVFQCPLFWWQWEGGPGGGAKSDTEQYALRIDLSHETGRKEGGYLPRPCGNTQGRPSTTYIMSSLLQV
jgi:hypothetical protein